MVVEADIMMLVNIIVGTVFWVRAPLKALAIPHADIVDNSSSKLCRKERQLQLGESRF
jgi:hypothetical protein